MEPHSETRRAKLTPGAGRRPAILTFLILLSAGLAPGLLRLETDNSPAVFFVEDSTAVETYRRHREAFGSDVTLRLVFEGSGLWTTAHLQWMSELEGRLTAIPGVLRVSGLPGHYRRFGWPPQDLDAFRDRARANTLDRGAGWISADGGIVTLLVQIEALSSIDNSALLDEIHALVAEPPKGVICRLLGLPVLNQELDRSSREIEQVFFPLLVLLTILGLRWVLGSLRRIWAPLLFVGFCQLVALSLMGYSGARLNMVLAVLPPLVFAVSLATAVHLVLHLRRAPVPKGNADTAPDEPVDLRKEKRIATVFHEKRWAVLWTGVTTVVGFASLTLSPLSPVRALGLWAAIALAAATATVFLFLPTLLATFGFGSATAESWEGRWARRGEALGRRVAIHRKPILAAAGLTCLVALLGLPRLQTVSNALEYLAPDHPLRAGIERLEKHGIGVAGVELLITMPPPGPGGAPPAFTSAIEVDRLADLGTELEQIPGIFGVVSMGSVLRDALLHVPTTPTNAHFRQQMALEGLHGDVEGRAVLDALLTRDRLSAHATIFVETTDIDTLNRITTKVLETTRSHFPEASVTTTGQYPLLLEAQNYLLSTLFSSLGLTLLVVAVILRLVLPSFRLALLALVPNIWPVLGTFGVMGWAGVPLDIASVMMASVVLGLAVDDSIHTLGHFRRLAPKLGAATAVEKTLFATAPAYVLTSLILMSGFGVCALSSFAPIARFGAMSSLAVGLALIGDLFLLPALLSLTPTEVARRLSR